MRKLDTYYNPVGEHPDDNDLEEMVEDEPEIHAVFNVSLMSTPGLPRNYKAKSPILVL